MLMTASPVRRVSVFSTGTVRIHPEHIVASGKPLYWWILTSREWLAPRPINVYVIEHTDGLILFDAGQDRASVTQRDYFPGGPLRILYDRLARFDIPADEALPEQIRKLGYRLEDIRAVVLSHLHQDHIGGIPDLRQAEFVVSAREWTDMQRPFAAARGFLREHIDLPGLTWRRLTFDDARGQPVGEFTQTLDLLEDGSLTVIPTPGHTPGSLSLLVNRDSPSPLLVVGDLTYSARLLDEGKYPGVGQRGPIVETSRRVRNLRSELRGLRILPAHDPEAATRLIAAA